jgi:Kef-type K+ transport system membrane component KefB
MRSLSEQQLLLTLVDLAIILVFSRAAVVLARWLRQAEVLGLLFAGFVLGPSVLGVVLPAVYHTLFLNGAVSLVLSAFSWVGAALLLLLAGAEVDLRILRAEIRPGTLAAAGAIIPSLAAGTVFSWLVLHRGAPYGFFLGIVLSVTAVSVAAKLLLERDAMRRRYAQVIMAAGVASEVLVWVLVSVLAAVHSSSPVLAALRSAVYAVGFFLIMMTVGRRLTFWAMRRVADTPGLIQGQRWLSLVLALLAAALTQFLGLHVLLGAFVVGVLLSQTPRTDQPFVEGVQALTMELLVPVFFVLAGMRVNVFQLGGPASIGLVLLLFVVATLVKGCFSMLGARLGGLRGWEAPLVGAGLNLKGGTDVIVAIIGVESGLLSVRAYSMYTVVAMLTVLVSPTLMRILAAKAPPGPQELARLKREEAKRQAYLPRVERLLVPVLPALLPHAVARVVEQIARAKRLEHETFDIATFEAVSATPAEPLEGLAVAQARESLSAAGHLAEGEVRQRQMAGPDIPPLILDATRDHDLIAIGAGRPDPALALSLGPLQDRIIEEARTNVLVIVEGDNRASAPAERILVAINGLEHSLAAADVAAYLARAAYAELVLFNVRTITRESSVWQDPERRGLMEAAGYRTLREATPRIAPSGVRVSMRVELGEDPGAEIVHELQRRPYQLVVLGAVNRGGGGRLDLGACIPTVLTQSRAPAVLLVSRDA